MTPRLTLELLVSAVASAVVAACTSAASADAAGGVGSEDIVVAGGGYERGGAGESGGCASNGARSHDVGAAARSAEARRSGGPIAPEAASPQVPSCPDDAPFVCPDEDGHGYACSALACAPSCLRVGCPSAFECRDCGGGAACVPREHLCGGQRGEADEPAEAK